MTSPIFFPTSPTKVGRKKKKNRLLPKKLGEVKKNRLLPQKLGEVKNKTDFSPKSWEKYVKNSFSALSVIGKKMTSPNLL